jgi:hypothetical protein
MQSMMAALPVSFGGPSSLCATTAIRRAVSIEIVRAVLIGADAVRIL